MSKYWPNVSWKIVKKTKKNFSESKLLRLNCNKAKKKLRWKSVLSFQETIEMVAGWYKEFYSNINKADNITQQ